MKWVIFISVAASKCLHHKAELYCFRHCTNRYAKTVLALRKLQSKYKMRESRWIQIQQTGRV